jgi:ribulose-5-phosphate 4-epimerase/fuculose-1-phosphate aldolase
LIHTAAVFRDFSRKGFTEGQSGHISVRDPEFEHYIWMNPLGKHFGLMTAGDLICLDVNTGKVVGGNKVRFSEDQSGIFTEGMIVQTCKCCRLLDTL